MKKRTQNGPRDQKRSRIKEDLLGCGVVYRSYVGTPVSVSPLRCLLCGASDLVKVRGWVGLCACVSQRVPWMGSTECHGLGEGIY